MEDPTFADGPADLFFSAPEADSSLTEAVIQAVGLRPIYVGEDQEALIDALFLVWIALAIEQGRGRRLAMRFWRVEATGRGGSRFNSAAPAHLGLLRAFDDSVC